MKLIFTALLFTSFTAKASPLLSMKDRLRLHMWTYGLEVEQKPDGKKKENRKVLPEEIERALRKI